ATHSVECLVPGAGKSRHHAVTVVAQQMQSATDQSLLRVHPMTSVKTVPLVNKDKGRGSAQGFGCGSDGHCCGKSRPARQVGQTHVRHYCGNRSLIPHCVHLNSKYVPERLAAR